MEFSPLHPETIELQLVKWKSLIEELGKSLQQVSLVALMFIVLYMSSRGVPLSCTCRPGEYNCPACCPGGGGGGTIVHMRVQ